ncbi:MAG: beta-ketoacyl-[acyl-carrier-protein] synthase family protein [Victivallales bacterium]|nr:beta-ketoacyl-[acyl-carrier-protein] synthase family protein [Victivallales bacterium]
MTACITGIGCVSAAGGDCPENFKSLLEGRRGKVSSSDTGQVVFAAPLEARPESSRSVQLLDAALEELMIDSRIKLFPRNIKVGVVVGTTSASFLNDIHFHRKLRDGKLDSPALARYLAGNPAEYIKHKLNLSGPALTVTNACSSGSDAIGVGMAWIEAGVCDMVVAGGCDELHPVSQAGFFALGVLSEGLCLPFDRDRDGLNLGEGAALMLLEKRTLAESRGAEIKAVAVAYAGSNDMHHITQPDPEGKGLERAVKKALDTAGITSDDIGFINAHGTGTLHNDAAECSAFARLFGQNCKYFSVKGLTGHTLGAAGAIEAVMTVMLLENAFIPVSAGFSACGNGVNIAPVCQTHKYETAYALSTSLAFGGCNSALIIGREAG